MIQFGPDVDVDRVDLKDEARIPGLVYLLHYLAGREWQYMSERTVIDKHIAAIIGVAPKAQATDTFAYERINELLLLVDESRVSRAFFDFFFQPSTPTSEIDLMALRNGITRFRGFALLKFGNFRFAFRRLREIDNKEALRLELAPWSKDTTEILRGFGSSRTDSISQDPDVELGEDDTYLLGYIVKASLDEDRTHASTASDTKALAEAAKLDSKIDSAEKKARRNSSAYLASDYMDVYFATSMRQVWDFKETYRLIREVLGKLGDLKLRVFDPTQSHMDGIIDKGLVEALMLKRARCTVYLVQESDTLGKDSELAATLAQGKPVIAFVRSLSGSQLKDYAELLRRHPVSYFLRRAYNLFAEDFFSRPASLAAVTTKLAELELVLDPSLVERAAVNLVQVLKELRGAQKYTVLGGEEAEDDLRSRLFVTIPNVHKLMAAFDAVAFDRRASTLAKTHPLAMQVHLETGVANGVLVVRTTEQCANLLRGILTNDLQFAIEPKLERLQGADARFGTALRERFSGSNFRYVSGHMLLSNAFWNFYLRDEDRFTRVN